MLEIDYVEAEPPKPAPPVPVRVSRPSQLRAALRQHESPIVIEDQDLAQPFVRLLRGQEGGGLIVTPSALTATRRDLIIALAARLRLPAIYSFGFYAESGGLMSYGINQLELVRAAASYVDRILRGASPGDLPVQLPLRYELVINLKTAAALGLAVPNSAIARRQRD